MTASSRNSSEFTLEASMPQGLNALAQLPSTVSQG